MNGSKISESPYSINNTLVTEEAYEAFKSQLLPEQYDWSCADASDGGTVTYFLKDKSGDMYYVEEIDSGESSTRSISKRPK
jgi:hypothetical protein